MVVSKNNLCESRPWFLNLDDSEMDLLMDGLLCSGLRSKRFCEFLNELYFNVNNDGLYDKYRNGTKSCNLK